MCSMTSIGLSIWEGKHNRGWPVQVFRQGISKATEVTACILAVTASR